MMFFLPLLDTPNITLLFLFLFICFTERFVHVTFVLFYITFCYSFYGVIEGYKEMSKILSVKTCISNTLCQQNETRI